jgi:glycosyltransferase involved in cell wall biosynthesis
MKKIIYITDIRLPTEKAHGIQITKTCEALVKKGMEVELVIPERNNATTENIFDFYKITPLFSIKKIAVPQCAMFGKLGFLFRSFLFSLRSVAYARKLKPLCIYSRNKAPLLLGISTKMPLFFESHMGGWGMLTSFLLKRTRGIICITQGLKDFYVSHGVAPQRILVASDAVDLDLFKNLPGKEECRRETELTQDKKIIMYVGSFTLYAWKGLDIFLEAARLFENSFIFVAIGGTKDEIDSLKKTGVSKNVMLIEKLPSSKIPKYLKAADVLVLPNRSGNIISEKYTSPMKLFEYMASGTPIVASDLPSIREVVNDTNGILVAPDKPDALAQGIEEALIHGGSKAERALIDVREKYSWLRRAQIIIDFITRP